MVSSNARSPLMPVCQELYSHWYLRSFRIALKLIQPNQARHLQSAQILLPRKSLISHLFQQPKSPNISNIHRAELDQSRGEVTLDRNLNTAIANLRSKKKRTSVENRHKKLKVSAHSKILHDLSRRSKPRRRKLKKLVCDDKDSAKDEPNPPLLQPSGIFDSRLLFNGRLYQVIDLSAEVSWVPNL